jgi:hypothetical protein
MNKFYYIDLKDDIYESLIFLEIETDLTRSELVFFLERKAIEYCSKNNISIDSYYEDDEYIDYDLFDVIINKKKYFFRIATFIGDKNEKHLFDNLESLFTKLKILNEEII